MTTLAMTKIIVADLEKAETFYRTVCGFDQVDRIKGDGFQELIMRPADTRSGAALVLFHDGTSPPPGEAVLVFDTPDVAVFSEKVVAAGGEVTHPAQFIEALGLTFAMYRDPEGHVLEAVAWKRT